MVQKNNDEERQARIEHLVEALQQADAARKGQATTLKGATGFVLLHDVAGSLLPIHTSRKAS